MVNHSMLYVGSENPSDSAQNQLCLLSIFLKKFQGLEQLFGKINMTSWCIRFITSYKPYIPCFCKFGILVTMILVQISFHFSFSNCQGCKVILYPMSALPYYVLTK